MKKNSLLFLILKKLDKTEIRQIKKFVQSSFITHRTDIRYLFDCLSNCLYKKLAFPSNEVLFQFSFPDEDIFDDQKLRNTVSDLHIVLEQYLWWKTGKEDQVGIQLALAKTFRERNLSKHFYRSIDKIKVKQKKQAYKNAEYYQNSLQCQVEIYQFQSENQRSGKLNLQEIGDTIDILYLAQKLRHVCNQLFHKAVYKTDYQFGLLKHLIDNLEESPYLNTPAIALYYYCYRFLTEEYSQSYFHKFRIELAQHQSLFPKEEIKDLYKAAINFCIRKLNEDDNEFTIEAWELFQKGLADGFLIENNRLSRFTFDNIVGIGLRLKKYEEVELFIEKYQVKLEISIKEGTIFFNRARLEYRRKNYGEALQYLQVVDTKDLVVQLISKTMILKIYYELEEFDLLEFQLDSFRQFIQRRELSDYHQANFQNIIKFTRKLIALQPYNKTERKGLETAIESEKTLTEKKWLLEKLAGKS